MSLPFLFPVLPVLSSLNSTAIPPAEPAFYIAGPTGVGKSEFAVQLAERIGGEIVGADAFQVYDGLPILTAQPGLELRARVPHYLIGEIPLNESFNVAAYLRLASHRIAEIRARGRVAVVVGGTGLYLRGLIHGLADLPTMDEDLRATLEQLPLAELQRKLSGLDPLGFAGIDAKNPRRLIRALEVCILTGRPFSSFQEQWSNAPAANGVLLQMSRSRLYDRINQRTAGMFAAGVVEEVSAAGSISPTAQQVLGFREIQSLLAGGNDVPRCIEAIQQQTRRYAKRQLTWFRRETWLREVLVDENCSEGIAKAADLIMEGQP